VLGAAAVGLAGCTRGSSEPDRTSAPTEPSAPTDPDARLREAVAESELALIAAYRAAIESTPELGADLAPFLAHHEQHLDRVAPAFADSAGQPSPSASGSTATSVTSPTPSGSAAGSSNVSPGATSAPSAADTLTALAAAESRAQAERATACDGAQDPALARDLCLIAASEAQHAAALDDLAGEEPQS